MTSVKVWPVELEVLPCKGANQFIDRPMSLLLDAVRGLAALLVLVGHAAQMGFYTGYYPFDARLQHSAVVVFFVLSGLVIAHSANRPEMDLRAYAIARFARIAPVALFAVAFSTALASYAHFAGLQDGSVAPYDKVGIRTTLVPLMLLGERIPDAGLVWNPPFWSLTYEAWYYALFGAAAFLAGRMRVAVVSLLALLAGWQVLLLLPVWLLGVAIVHWEDRPRLRDTRAFAVGMAGMAAMISSIAFQPELRDVLLAVTGVPDEQFRFSSDFLSDYGTGLGVALCFIGLQPIARRSSALLHRLERPIGWLAGCSFTLYLTHWPMMMFIRGYGIGMGNSLSGFVALLMLIVMLAGLMASIVERQSPRLRLWLLARTAQRPLAA